MNIFHLSVPPSPLWGMRGEEGESQLFLVRATYKSSCMFLMLEDKTIFLSLKVVCRENKENVARRRNFVACLPPPRYGDF